MVVLDQNNISNLQLIFLNFYNKIPFVSILLIAHSDNVAKKCSRI